MRINISVKNYTVINMCPHNYVSPQVRKLLVNFILLAVSILFLLCSMMVLYILDGDFLNSALLV